MQRTFGARGLRKSECEIAELSHNLFWVVAYTDSVLLKEYDFSPESSGVTND